MPLNDLKLSLMAFPQLWNGTNLHLHVLVLPVGNPFAPLTPTGPPFAGTELHLEARLIRGLASFPDPAAPADIFTLKTSLNSTLAASLFKQLPGNNTIVGKKGSAKGIVIKKALPQSYINSFAFEQPRNPEFNVIGKDFGCSIRAKNPHPPNTPPPPREISWGQLISFALRQPILARALGLLYEATIPVESAAVRDGGWVYVALDTPNSTFPYVQDFKSNSDLVKSYAARLPPLTKERALFAAVLFPVVKSLPNQKLYDDAVVEAEDYDDGFAKIVHCHQPDSTDAIVGDQNQVVPATDAGIQIGWDDEQVTIWYNRQLKTALSREAAVPDAIEAPMGVLGYRVDAQDSNAVKWNPLSQTTGKINYGPLTATVEGDDGQIPIQPVPVRSATPGDNEAWLPQYFAQWRGRSLAVSDQFAYLLTGGERKQQPSFLTELLPPELHLRYGQKYKFRVRLADLTGGGPRSDDVPINPAAATSTECLFLRYVPPKSVRVETTMKHIVHEIDTIKVWRPLLGYPDFTFTRIAEASGIQDDDVTKQLVSFVEIAKKKKLVLGVSDPDVTTLSILVEARAPAHDTGTAGEAAGNLDGPFRVVYQFERPFPNLKRLDLNKLDPTLPPNPDEAITLVVAPQDVNNIKDLKQPDEADPQPLPIPTARDIRIRLTPIGKDQPNYFATKKARTGLTTDLTTRFKASEEKDLFVSAIPAKQLNAIMLQPADNIAQLLAEQLDLEVNGLTFSARPGQRIVFGASKAIRHTLSGDHSSITFAAQSELLHHWIVAIMLDLNRDWTWDGLAPPTWDGLAPENSFIFKDSRDNIVGTLDVRQTVSSVSTIDEDLVNRATTRLVFFDTVDPNATPPSGFPVSSSLKSPVAAQFKDGVSSTSKVLKVSPNATPPNSIVVPPPLRWTVIPQFKDGVPSTPTVLEVSLPVASPPHQTPRIVSAGIALSPYESSQDYSSTKSRRRVLWLEFEEEPLDPNDSYFARVLGYGPDPLLSTRLLLEPAPNPVKPPLPIDPEPIRIITPGQPTDNSGLGAMVELVQSSSSKRHFMVPLPPGITPDSLELFGFWTYELRVGHSKVWSTAQARFGRPLEATGVQHPVPALNCVVNRRLAVIEVSVPFATPVLNGRNLIDLTLGDPRTRIWVLLYAQVMQADGQSFRNILLAHKAAKPLRTEGERKSHPATRDVFGQTFFTLDEIVAILMKLALPPNSPLSVLAVELLPPGTDTPSDPLGTNLGQERILRTSPLTPVPPICLTSLET